MLPRQAWVASLLDCADAAGDWRSWFVLAVSLWHWRRHDGVGVLNTGIRPDRGGPQWASVTDLSAHLAVSSAGGRVPFESSALVSFSGWALAPDARTVEAYVCDVVAVLATLVPEAVAAGDVDPVVLPRMRALWRKLGAATV